MILSIIDWAWLVGNLYGTVGAIYNWMMDICFNNRLDSIPEVQDILNKIYMVVGVFMVFRILISLLQYLTDPDKIGDKQVGGGKLLIRIVVSLVLLLSLNSLIFPKLSDLQNAIIGTDTAEGLISRIFNNAAKENANSQTINTGTTSSILNDFLLKDINVGAYDTCEQGATYDPDDCFAQLFTKYPGLSQNKDLKAKIASFIEENTTIYGFSIIDHECTEGKNNYNCYNYVEKYIDADIDNATYCGDESGCTRELKDFKQPYEIKFNDENNTDFNFLNFFSVAYGETKGICNEANGSISCEPITVTVTYTVPVSEEHSGSEDFKKTCYYIFRRPNEDIQLKNNFYDSNGMPQTACDKETNKFLFAVNYEYTAQKRDLKDSNYIIQNIDSKDINGIANQNGKWSMSIPNLNFELETNVNVDNGIRIIENYLIPDERFKCPPAIGKMTYDEQQEKPYHLTYQYHYVLGYTYYILSDPDKDYTEGTFLTHATFSAKDTENAYFSDIEKLCPNDQNIEHSSKDTEENNYSCEWPTGTGNGKQFAHNMAMSFFDQDVYTKRCKGDNDCNNAYNCYIKDQESNELVGKQMNKGNLSLDGFMGTIGGIIAIVFMATLIIEVYIRIMKLILLQLISPIAVVSYMNPQDKIFSQWVKMYAATYADLFLKLIGIEAAFFVVNTLINSPNSPTGIAKFALYLAAFLFAKQVPNLISKLFGLDAAGGTFKDSFGMLKAGAGLVAGAAIGGAIGLTSGIGRGGSLGTAVGGLLGGITRGAQGGARGQVLSGANAQRDRNVRIREANTHGGSFFGRAGAAIAGTFGAADAYTRYQNEIADREKEAADHRAQAAAHKREQEKSTAVTAYANGVKERSLAQMNEGKLGRATTPNGAATTYAKIHRQMVDADNAHDYESRDRYKQQLYNFRDEHGHNLEERAIAEYLKANTEADASGTYGDTELAVTKQSFESQANEYGISDVSSADYGDVISKKDAYAVSAGAESDIASREERAAAELDNQNAALRASDAYRASEADHNSIQRNSGGGN